MRPGWSIRARRNRPLKIANGVDKTNKSVPNVPLAVRRPMRLALRTRTKVI